MHSVYRPERLASNADRGRPDPTRAALTAAAVYLLLAFAAAPRAAAPPPRAQAGPVPSAAAASARDRAHRAFNEGTRLAEAGKNAAAIEQFQAALRLDPTLTQAYQNLGILYTRVKQYGQAEAALRKAIAARPKDLPPLFQLAAVQRLSGQPGAARDTLERAVALAPGNLVARLSLAQSYEQEGLLPAAEAQLQAAVDAAPHSVPARRELARFYFQNKRHPQFERTLERIWTLDPHDPQVAFDIALTAHQQKQWSKAVTYYRAALRLEPGNQAAWQNLATVYAQLKRPKLASDALKHAAGAGAPTFRLEMALGLAAFNSGDYPGAETAFRRAARLSPGSVQARVDLGAALVRQRKLADAEPVYAKLRSSGDTSLAVLQPLAYLYAVRGRPRLAAELYRKMVTAHPTRSDLRRMLATLLIQQNQTDAAIAELKAAHDAAPADAAISDLLASLYEQNHRIGDAVALDEERVRSRPALYRQLADLHRQQGHADLALIDLQNWTRAEPKSVDARMALSSAYEADKKIPEARAALEAARAADPTNARLAEALSGLEVRAGQAARAEEILRTAVASTPNDASLHAALADLLATKDPAESIRQLEQAARDATDPAMAAAYGVRVAQQMKKSGDPGYRAQYQRLVQQYPNDANLRLEWGAALAEKMDYVAAMTQALAVLDHDPASFPDGFRAVQSYASWARLGHRQDEALQALEKIAERHPEAGTVLGSLSSLWVEQEKARKVPADAADPGLAFFRKLAARHPDADAVPWVMADYAGQRGLIDERIAILNAQAVRDPHSPTAPNLLGSLYTERKQWDRAAGAYREAIRRAPKTTYFRSELARALESAGKVAAALDEYRAVLKAEPANPTAKAAIARLQPPPKPGAPLGGPPAAGLPPTPNPASASGPNPHAAPAAH